MKKKAGTVLAVFIFLILAIFALFSRQQTKKAAAAKKTVTIVAATGGAPKPFTFVKNDKLTGHNIELLKAMFKKLPQYQLKIEKTKFESIFSGLNSDRYQIGVNNFAKNAEREKNYLFTDPIFKNAYVVIFKKNSPLTKKVDSWSDLNGLSTVGSTGVNTTTAIEEYNKKHTHKKIDFHYSAEDLASQLRSIESGKYDFLLMDKPMFDYYQKEFKYNLETKSVSGSLKKELLAEPYSYLIVSKGNQRLVKDINKALKEVVKDGTSKKINEKYFGEDYSPTYK
ncbi:transporter substrate-binding domain-containing protein [Streptococcus troglodytae]|uniref:Amino acid ABC superfamily ATP binding cassette transporter substrate binding protein n=1 Tax=Streptococcus troglodytae TaxID=1111760 RepID=A0A1L7LJQ0_9STRE|nr:transporter substrate-binding domain-containing protein [Streptococcus troglodytae]BAQ24423.1 amino acid ABC superfamily ATP binding cassette transporter substrate binding protein [Streptococcus troglodytae]